MSTTGIYKITSPSGKIYTGQSVNIENRFKKYRKKNSCKSQVRLNRSFNKYGISNHVFEILEVCSESQLNNRERHYQDLSNCTNENGLNCRLTKSNDKSGKLNKEMLLKKNSFKEKGENINSKKVLNTISKEEYNSLK